MWTVNEAPPRQFRNQLIEAASADAAPTPGTLTYDNWRRQLSLIRTALAPFPEPLAAVAATLDQPSLAGREPAPADGLATSLW